MPLTEVPVSTQLNSVNGSMADEIFLSKKFEEVRSGQWPGPQVMQQTTQCSRESMETPTGGSDFVHPLSCSIRPLDSETFF